MKMATVPAAIVATATVAVAAAVEMPLVVQAIRTAALRLCHEGQGGSL